MHARHLALALLLSPLAGAADGWVDLFDGKTTEGWTPRAKVESFEAVDGELHLLTKTNCWVTTEIQMADFEAELEVMLPAEPGFNSGLAFRCVGAKGKPKGYQVEIDRAFPGGVYGIGTGGWLYPGKADKAAFAAKIEGLLKPEEWNHFKVRAEGPRIQTWLNGKAIADIEHKQILKGYFGIQHHGKGGVVKFRNIRARALKSKDLKLKASTGGKPNILWITAEDMSPALGCYGDEYAISPHIDKLAERSTRYDKAFAVSPVCSPSRSSLITGIHNVTMGTNQMRSAFPLPEGVKGFPSYLRAAGYFTSNNVKTDYNSSDAGRLIAESWDESSAGAHWRSAKRKEGQPFFSVFNLMTSHQSRSMVWPHAVFEKHVQSKLSAGEIHGPATAPIPPYYPDTEVVRRGIARFYDCVTAMDKEVGAILAQLEEDGLADDTIVFFYSDHGSGMPRHKRLLHDSGMRVAMLVHLPEKWKHLRPTKPGGGSDRLVSFLDLPPTVLDLTGIAAPPYMQGTSILGKDEREYVYGSRDRVDEAFDTARSIRDGRWLYIRNYMPHLSYNQPSVFSDLGEIRGDIGNIFNSIGAARNPTAAQYAYIGPTRRPVEFYDCESDPHNVRNLAGTQMSDEGKAAFARLSKAFVETRAELRDAGALPESEMRRWATMEGVPIADVLAGATDHRPDLAAAWAAADLGGTGEQSTMLKLLPERLKSDSVSERYWAIIGMRYLEPGNVRVFDRVAEHIDDSAPSVRIEAAGWLAGEEKYRQRALARLVADLEHDDWAVALRACRAIELLGDKAKSVLPVMRKLYDRTRHVPGDNNFFIAFSSGAFLDMMGEKTDPWDFTPGAGSFMPPKKMLE